MHYGNWDELVKRKDTGARLPDLIVALNAGFEVAHYNWKAAMIPIMKLGVPMFFTDYQAWSALCDQDMLWKSSPLVGIQEYMQEAEGEQRDLWLASRAPLFEFRRNPFRQPLTKPHYTPGCNPVQGLKSEQYLKTGKYRNGWLGGCFVAGTLTSDAHPRDLSAKGLTFPAWVRSIDSDPEFRLQPGTRVQLQGLRARPELNGVSGTISGFFATEAGILVMAY